MIGKTHAVPRQALGHLWGLVNNPCIREVFYQYTVNCVDTSVIKTGRAPMTSSKADAAAEQCPVGIKWLKSAIFEQPNCAAQVPSWVGDDYQQRSAWEDDKDRMTFHRRVNNSRALRNLLDEEYQKAALREDFGKRNGIKCILPINHISACVAASFKGQSWMRYNEDDIKTDFVQLGLKVKSAKLAGITRRGLMFFPSIEGIMYLLRKKGWMTAVETVLLSED